MVLVDLPNGEPGTTSEGVETDGGILTAAADRGGGGELPREVEFIISALEAGPRPLVDRHKLRRFPYRVRATLKLYSDAPDAPPVVVYTRHIHRQAVGILSPRPLPLSHGGILRVRTPAGELIEIACAVLRCREVAAGWFEGALYFNRPQKAFAPEAFEPLAAATD